MASQTKRSVLIVGECATVRAKIRKGVERSGVGSLILEVNSAFEAIAMLGCVKVDLVLVSSRMHPMESAALISRIHTITNGRSKCMLVDEKTEKAAESSEANMAAKTLFSERRSLNQAEFWAHVMNFLTASEAAADKAVEN